MYVLCVLLFCADRVVERLPLEKFQCQQTSEDAHVLIVRAVAAAASALGIQRWLNWFSERRLTSRKSARPLIWFVVRAIEDLLSAWWECVRYKVANRYMHARCVCCTFGGWTIAQFEFWQTAEKTTASEKRKREPDVQDWGHSPRMMNWTANCPLHSWAINTNVLSAKKYANTSFTCDFYLPPASSSAWNGNLLIAENLMSWNLF
jgi:hypothetical protein